MPRYLVRYLWTEEDRAIRWRVVLCLLLIILSAGIGAAAPILFARAIDTFTHAPASWTTTPLLILGVYWLVAWLGRLLGELQWYAYGPIEQRLQRRLSLALFDHLHGLSLRFHLTKHTGGLSRTISRGLNGARELLFNTMFFVLPVLIEFTFICIIVLGGFSFMFAAVIIGTILGYLVILIVGSEKLRRIIRESNKESSAAHGAAIDGLLNYETVKYFGAETLLAARYDARLRVVEYLSVRALFWRSLTGVAQWTILGGSIGGLLLVAGSRVGNGTLTVGDLVLLNTYLLRLVRPLDILGRIYRALRVAITDLEQMLELLEEEPEIRDAPGARELGAGPGQVRFENVSFSYDPRRPVLGGIDFDVQPGRTVAIVGASGAGKSTIARLLFRFYDPAAGRILIDGQDLRDVSQESLRAAIAVVPQDTVLFNESLFENIALARPSATEREVHEAARAAQLEDFVATLPEGWLTVVGERGLKLSGGEKQRVAIARAILKRPRILILDEATSALDSATERMIQQQLLGLTRDTTTIAIAHRLSTVIHAHQIIFLDSGVVAERGTHEQLLRRQGSYAAAWMRQAAASHDKGVDKPALTG